jgi:hypothetical protein
VVHRTLEFTVMLAMRGAAHDVYSQRGSAPCLPCETAAREE